MNRDNSLLASKYIYTILDESTEIKSILGNDKKKIFALQQPDKISFPFIVFQRNSLSVSYTKDYPLQFGWTNTLQFEIACVSDDYIESIELANAVRHSVEGYRWTDRDENQNVIIKIDPIRIVSVNEYVVDTDSSTAFVQSILITFDCE